MFDSTTDYPALKRGNSQAVGCESVRVSKPSGWINAAEMGVSGSEWIETGMITAGSNRLTLKKTGDFLPGQWITAEGCFFHSYGTVYNENAPYFAKNQKRLDGEIEVRGLNNSRNWQTFVLLFHSSDPVTFSWMAVDPKYQTKQFEDPLKTFYWEWQQEQIRLCDRWMPLADGVEIRFVRKDWKPGEIISLHVRNRLIAKIEDVQGNTLVLNRTANSDCNHAIVKHNDQYALQQCLDHAAATGKGMRIPSGRFRLINGLNLRDASMSIEGTDPIHTIIDISECHTAAFWVGGGREFILRNLAIIGNTGFYELPANRPFTIGNGFYFWPTANQQMEVFGSAALNIVGTEYILCENLSVSRMASEAFYLHGSDRGGTPPFIQSEYEGMESIGRQYTRQCIFRRCNVFDCGFNAFNNNDFAENTQILNCHVENVGNFCENASRFTRVSSNYIFNTHAMSVCAVRSPNEFTGLSQAVITDNVFEGGSTHRGLGILADEVIVSNNVFTGFSKESAVKIEKASRIVFTGNIIDLTRDSGNPDHPREGVSVNGQNIIIADNQITSRGQNKKNITGIAISDASQNVLIHDNIIQNCATGIRSGIRVAQRQFEDDATSCHWNSEYTQIFVEIQDVSGDVISGRVAEHLLLPKMMSGKWQVHDPAGKLYLISEITLENTIIRIRLSEADASEFHSGQKVRIRPSCLNWRIHDNMIQECDHAVMMDVSAEDGVFLTNNGF